MPLYAGVCETNITPPPGIWMGGYAARPGVALGVHDELRARAFVIDDGTQRAVIVAADVIAFPLAMSQRIRQEIADALDTTPDAVLLNASHTHGGALTGIYREMGEPDDGYLSVLTRKLVGAATQAAQTLTPVVLTYGVSSAQIGVNRRQTLPDRKTVLGMNTAGAVVPQVQAMCATGFDGSLLALLFSHACHPTTMGGENRLFTAEWCGAATEMLAKKLEREAAEAGRPNSTVPIFLQGCAGDINPIRRGDWEAVRENGRQVAVAADAARWNAHGRLAETISAEEITLDLPCADGNRLPFAIQHLTLGGIHLLGFPGEMFAEYALAFARMTQAPMISLGYTNGCHGYIPTSEAFAYGGYEVSDAAYYYQTPALTPECDSLLQSAVEKLLA